jgi:hypothetical protein
MIQSDTYCLCPIDLFCKEGYNKMQVLTNIAADRLGGHYELV